MFSRASNLTILKGVKAFSTSSQNNFKVALLGAAGGIGQPMGLLLKQSPLVTELRLYDIVNTPGVAADLSHIDTASSVKGYLGPDQLDAALKGCDVVMIPAGVPRKPGMTRDDLFSTNASIVRDLICGVARNCPKAFIGIIANPVNSTVPIAAEVLKSAGVYDPKRLFGVSTLDIVRARKFIGDAAGVDPQCVDIPILCGHSGSTIIPVISQCKPAVKFAADKIKALTERIQEAGTEVVKAKAGTGSATLSMAYAGASFAFALMRGLKGEPNIIQCAYVQSDVCDTKYFATPLLLGKNGIEKNLGIPPLNDYEKEILSKGLADLKKNIKDGEDFINKGK